MLLSPALISEAFASDLAREKRMAPERLAMMQKAGNPLSEQVVVPDADHYFHDSGAPLFDAVSTWLASVAGSKGWVK